MIKKDILSVIVTSYNYENYIGQTLDSLVNQTNTDFSIIVIDDGSKDNSVSIIKEYAKKYDSITFIQHENGQNKGLCETTKAALSYVNSEYVAFCESDDYWKEDHVEKLLNFLSKNDDVNLLFNEIEVKNYSSNSEYDGYVNYSNQKLKEFNGSNIFHVLTSNYMPTFSSACIKTSLLKKCDFNSYYPQYLDFWLWRQLCLNNNIYFLDNCITYWRKHDSSYDMKDNVRDLKKFLIASNDLIIKQIKTNISTYEYLKIKIQKYVLCSKKYLKYQMKKILKFRKS